MRSSALRRNSVWTASPAILITLICAGIPLLWMLWMLATHRDTWQEFLPSSFRVNLLVKTLLYNGGAGVLATLMGLPAAFVIGRGRGMMSRLLLVLLPAALLMPSLSYAYGWWELVRLIRPITIRWGIGFFPQGPADISRCILTLASWLWGVPALLIGLSLRRSDSSVQQQALLDGALCPIMLRQLLGPICASIAIVTILATQDTSVYEPTGISVVATEIRMVFDTGTGSVTDNAPPDLSARASAAIATAMPLMVITFLLAGAAVWCSQRSSGADAIATDNWPRVLDCSKGTVIFTTFLLIFNWLTPTVALVVSMHHGISLVDAWSKFGSQLQGTAFVAAEATCLALAVAFFSAARWFPGLLVLSGTNFLLGGQLLAIALIRIYDRPAFSWVYDTSLVTVFAYLGRFGWVALAGGRATWSTPWIELREMAATDGADGLETVATVIWPLAWPILLASGLLVGILCTTEVPATVLLMPQNPQVLTPTMMAWVHMARYDPMIQACLLMSSVILVPAVVSVLLISMGARVLKRK